MKRQKHLAGVEALLVNQVTSAGGTVAQKLNLPFIKEAIAKAGGVSRAADIVETAISTGQPVLNQTR